MASAGTEYLVDIVLDVKQKPGKKLGVDAKKIGDECAQIGTRLVDGFEGAVEKVGGIVAGLGKAGIAAAVGAVTYGVLGLNQELESTQVSLAAVLNANGIGGGMEGAMHRASDWMRQMRKDAKDLPGEFSDLLGIVQSGASAAFNAGLDVKGFERIASQGMAAAKAMAVPMDQAGRELAQLLEGRAGGHNVFGTRLGIHAAEFNTKTPADRLKIITTALGKFEPAIAVFGSTMDAQSSTLVDNAKIFLSAATGPLFERIKGTLGEINAWFDANEGTTKRWAAKIGDFLVDAFDRGKALVLEFGPPFLEFIKNGKDEFLSIWQEAGPYLKSIGDSIKGFLSDPNAFDKIENVLKLYIAAKVGGAAFGIGKDVGTLVNGVGALGGMLGGGGAATAAGETAVAAEGATAGGGAMAALGISAGTAAAALAGLTVAVGASVYFMDQAVKENDAVGKNWVDMMVNTSTMFAIGVDNASGMIDTSGSQYLTTLNKLRETSETNALAYEAEVKAHNEAIVVGAQLTESFVTMNGAIAGLLAKMPKTNLVMDAPPIDEAAEKKAAEARAKKGVAGKGGVTIHRVDITVSSNKDPSQIARDTFAVFTNERRYRTSSPRTTNFSAGR